MPVSNTSRVCANCRYWSELVAWGHIGEPMHALCLSASSPNSSKQVSERLTCSSWKENLYGAMDDPSRLEPYPEELGK